MYGANYCIDFEWYVWHEFITGLIKFHDFF